MRIRQVKLAIGLLLAASSGGLLILASIGIITGSAEFWIPYQCGGGILTPAGRIYNGCPAYDPRLDMTKVADVWALLGFFMVFASIGGLASLFLRREFVRPVVLGVTFSVSLVAVLSWWMVLSVFIRYSYYTIPGIFLILPFASLLLAISGAIALTVFIIQESSP